MKEQTLKLSDKSVLLLSGFAGASQALLSYLTELGANVCLAGPGAQFANSFVDSLNTRREIYPDYGRAFALGRKLVDDKDLEELSRQAAESFGSVDIIIDAHRLYGEWPPSTAAWILERAKNILGAKKKSRYIVLDHMLKPSADFPADTFASGYPNFSTFNILSLSLCEEYLLKEFPKSPSIQKSLEEYRKTHPSAKLLNSYDVAFMVACVASPLANTLYNQKLNIGLP